jgi:hypothetical protein
MMFDITTPCRPLSKFTSATGLWETAAAAKNPAAKKATGGSSEAAIRDRFRSQTVIVFVQIIQIVCNDLIMMRNSNTLVYDRST